MSISEQTIDKQFTQNYKIIIQWRKIISFDFHHIPNLSIGFKITFCVYSARYGPRLAD